MASVNRLFSLLILSSLAVLAACGGGGSRNNPIPPPTGGFTPSSLNGTYVFSTAGNDVNGNFLIIAGSFSANGNRGITGGVLSLSGVGVGGTVSNMPVGGGSSYIITSDGRGQAQLKTSTALGTITLDFVLSSSSHGLITEFDGQGTGSGTLDLQSAASQAKLAGPFAFNLSGIDTGGFALATVGSFTLDASGTITSGVEDFNDSLNGADAFTSLPLSGSVTLATGSAPGTATLTTTGSLGTITLDVYPVDSTHLKFIETAGAALLAGDAFTQQGATLPTTATTFAFTIAGGVSTPIAMGGLWTIDGAGAISSGLVDVNDGGSVAGPLATSGSYVASGSIGGRTLFTVSGFSVATQFVAYPTAGAGLQLLESDGTGLLAGVALVQKGGASLAASQGYGLGLSAINTNGEEDDIAEFTTATGTFAGLIDINDQGSAVNFDQKLSGTYTLDSPSTGRGEFASDAFNGVFYAVDSSTVLFVETDSNQIGTGIFELQSAVGQGALAGHAMVTPRPSGRGTKRSNK